MQCYLANIQPEDEENVSAFVLEELVSGQVILGSDWSKFDNTDL